MEAQSFVIHTTAVLSQAGIARMGTEGSLLMGRPGGGGAAIFGPDGTKFSQDLSDTEEGIVYADLDLDAIVHAKSFVDLSGHYSRPDLLWLGVDNRTKECVRLANSSS